MATSGLQFYVEGFTGTVAITSGSTVTVTPSATDSPLSIFQTLATNCGTTIGGTWTVSVTTSGLLKLSTTFGSAWDIAFTGTTGTKCGFSSASYTKTGSITSETGPVGSFYPYSDQIGVVYALDVRTPMGNGKTTSAGGFWLNTPGTNHKRPILRFSVLRPEALEFVDAVQDIGNPAKVDVWDGTNSIGLYIGSIKTREENSISGWTEFDVEVVR